MAEYSYKCQVCGKEFVISIGMFQKISEIYCPDCRSNKTIKVYKPVGLIFKGGGFYSTDNRKDK